MDLDRKLKSMSTLVLMACHEATALLTKHDRRMPGRRGGSQCDRLRAAEVGNSPPTVPWSNAPHNEKAPSSKEKTGPDLGRRDWTRTNDPHHVKVVL